MFPNKYCNWLTGLGLFFIRRGFREKFARAPGQIIGGSVFGSIKYFFWKNEEREGDREERERESEVSEWKVPKNFISKKARAPYGQNFWLIFFFTSFQLFWRDLNWFFRSSNGEKLINFPFSMANISWTHTHTHLYLFVSLSSPPITIHSYTNIDFSLELD